MCLAQRAGEVCVCVYPLVCLCVCLLVSLGVLCMSLDVCVSGHPSIPLDFCVSMYVFSCGCCVHSSASVCVCESVCVYVYHCEDLCVVCLCVSVCP